jgi:hypothetical protein
MINAKQKAGDALRALYTAREIWNLGQEIELLTTAHLLQPQFRKGS